MKVDTIILLITIDCDLHHDVEKKRMKILHRSGGKREYGSQNRGIRETNRIQQQQQQQQEVVSA